MDGYLPSGAKCFLKYVHRPPMKETGTLSSAWSAEGHAPELPLVADFVHFAQGPEINISGS